jgi:hypothetical protein
MELEDETMKTRERLAEKVIDNVTAPPQIVVPKTGQQQV